MSEDINQLDEDDLRDLIDGEAVITKEKKYCFNHTVFYNNKCRECGGKFK